MTGAVFQAVIGGLFKPHVKSVGLTGLLFTVNSVSFKMKKVDSFDYSSSGQPLRFVSAVARFVSPQRKPASLLFSGRPLRLCPAQARFVFVQRSPASSPPSGSPLRFCSAVARFVSSQRNPASMPACVLSIRPRSKIVIGPNACRIPGGCPVMADMAGALPCLS